MRIYEAVRVVAYIILALATVCRSFQAGGVVDNKEKSQSKTKSKKAKAKQTPNAANCKVQWRPKHQRKVGLDQMIVREHPKIDE